MKNTKIINGLTVEFDNNSVYVILTVRRVDCSTLDSETFSKYITEDLLKADKIYADMREPILRMEHEKRMARLEADIRKTAELKYKRQSNRDMYIAQELEKLNKRAKFTDSIDYVDFKPSPSALGISSRCILGVDDVKQKAPRCFEEIKDDKYFKNAKGWVIRYQTMIDPHEEPIGLRKCFRAEVKTILDSNLENERQKGWSDTVNSVERFYSGCKYFGD